MGQGPKPAKSKAGAKSPVTRTSTKNDDARFQDLEKRLAEALKGKADAQEQQAATAEILHVISRSPADTQPVFDAIARNAVTLCSGITALVLRFDGEMLSLAGHHAMSLEGVKRNERAFPRRPARDFPTGRAFLDGSVIHVPDLQAATEYVASTARQAGAGSLLCVPLLHEHGAIGVIGVTRDIVGPFSSEQIKVLQTFAAQAVIAIANVRLFNETKEALERQTATSEILRVISSSPTDVQPVYDAIVRSAVTLCGATLATVYRREDDLVYLVGIQHEHPHVAEVAAAYPAPVTSSLMSCRAILENTIIHLPDVEADGALPPEGLRLAHLSGFRSVVSVPLRRDGISIGAIAINRMEPGPFTDEQVALLETFADQAVIAIENARLFTELQEKNRALTDAHAQVTEALEQQTATSEILRVISSSPTDTQPVFNAIARNAVALCGGIAALVLRFDGEMLHIAGHHEMSPDAVERVERAFPRRPGRDYPPGRALLERHVVHIPDLQAATEFTASTARQRGLGSMLVVPLLREGEAIGVISLGRDVVGPFSAQQIDVLQTFADQAVIAIENVRLFTELESRNKALAESLEQQTATSELLKVIGRSTFDLQPVFETLAENAVTLCEANRAFVFRFDGQVLRIVSGRNISPELRAFTEQNPVRPGHQSGAARAALERRTIHIHDVKTDDQYTYYGSLQVTIRTVLAVPMLRANELLGVIAVGRQEVRPFSDSQVALMQTFADQAVIAIENVRLFTELQEKNQALAQAHAQVTEALEQQTATSEILRVISSSPTDIQPVFDTIVSSAARLCNADDAQLLRREDDILRLTASYGTIPGELTRPIVRTRVAGRAVIELHAIHVPDLQAESHEFPDAQPYDIRSMLSIPLLREGYAVGVIQIRRREVRPFTNAQIALLETFADQAVIAIENVRLFTELQARTQELIRSVGQLTALGEVGQAVSSSLDLETVLTTIVSRAVQLSGLDGGVVFEYDEAAEKFVQRAA